MPEKEQNWTKYHKIYARHPEMFVTPENDRWPISKISYVLGLPFNDEKFDSLVLGVGGPVAVHEYTTLYPEVVRPSNGYGVNDNLFFTDIRPFSKNDKTQSKDNPLFRSDGTVLPFKEGQLDLVMTHCLFDCIDNDELRNILKEMQRVTKLGGYGIHTFCLPSLWERIFKRPFVNMKPILGIEYHTRTEKDILRCFANSGFQIIDLATDDNNYRLTVGCINVGQGNASYVLDKDPLVQP